MAVYTDIDAETLAAFLADYDLGAATGFVGILQGVENTNYRLETPAGRFVLTVFERRTAAADLPYFLALMSHLAAACFPAPRPVDRRTGGEIGRISGKAAAIVAFLDGVSTETPTAADAHAAGGALARLHLAGCDFPGRRPNDLGAIHWRALFQKSAGRADEVAPGLGAEILASLDWLEACWPADLPTGAIHADLFPDNLFLKDGAVSGVIDFYFACDDAYAYDLAIMLNAWCFDREGCWRDDLSEALTAGYRAERPLSFAEAVALPTLLAGAAMRFLLTRLYDWLNPAPGALVRPKNPLQQLACLRLHRSRLP